MSRAAKDTGRIATLVSIILPISCTGLSGQSARSLIDGGNKAYNSDEFVDAEVQYRKALEKENGLPEGNFNLGDALYKQGRYDVSAEAFDKALNDTSGSEITSKGLFNKGNALFRQQKYRESIDAYIESLKLAPDDLDAKHNLLHAMSKLKEQESSKDKQKPESGEGDDKQDKKQQQEQQSEQPDGEKKNEQENEQSSDNQEEEQPDKGQEAKRPDQGEKGDQSGQSPEENQPDQRGEDTQQPGGAKGEMSRAEAERILQALKESEMDVQKKLRKAPGGRARVEKDW